MGLTDSYKTFYPNKGQHTLFSTTHGIVSKIAHTLGHKASLNKYSKDKFPLPMIHLVPDFLGSTRDACERRIQLLALASRVSALTVGKLLSVGFSSEAS